MIIEKVERFKNGSRIIDKEEREGKKGRAVYYLKQCPYCSKAKLYFRYRGERLYALTCPRCDASTNFFASKELALDAPILK